MAARLTWACSASVRVLVPSKLYLPNRSSPASIRRFLASSVEWLFLVRGCKALDGMRTPQETSLNHPNYIAFDRLIQSFVLLRTGIRSHPTGNFDRNSLVQAANPQGSRGAQI